MTNVSTHSTDSKDFNKAYEQLQLMLAKLDKSQSSTFFEGLFTETEKIMFVKRFAAIVLFDQDFGPYKVACTISLSMSTTQRLFTRYSNGHYDKLLQHVPKQQRNNLVEILQDIMLSKVSFRARQRTLKRL